MELIPKAILCDIDGLLLDTERMARDMFLVTAMAHGLVDDAEVSEVFLGCVGTRAATSNEIIAKAFGDRTDVDQLRKDWTAALMPLWASDIPTKQGAAEMFALVKAQGLPIAVATSTKTDLAEEHLKHRGLWEYVTLVVGGDQVSEGKPAPETYLTAAKRLGVDITRCVAFEDSESARLLLCGQGHAPCKSPTSSNQATRPAPLVTSSHQICSQARGVQGWWVKTHPTQLRCQTSVWRAARRLCRAHSGRQDAATIASRNPRYFPQAKATAGCR